MGDEDSKTKWEGKAVAEIAGTGAEEVWGALSDFCNIHKWMSLDTCYKVEGLEGQPGLTRYCASAVKEGAGDTATINWAKERILEFDPVQRCYSYEVLDNNMGFKSYVATLKVLPQPATNKDVAVGCIIEWGFVCDPFQSWTFQGLNSYIQSILNSMAKKIELAHSTTK